MKKRLAILMATALLITSLQGGTALAAETGADSTADSARKSPTFEHQITPPPVKSLSNAGKGPL